MPLKHHLMLERIISCQLTMVILELSTPGQKLVNGSRVSTTPASILMILRELPHHPVIQALDSLFLQL